MESFSEHTHDSYLFPGMLPIGIIFQLVYLHILSDIDTPTISHPLVFKCVVTRQHHDGLTSKATFLL